MNMQELLDMLCQLEADCIEADIPLEKVQVIGYLLGAGVMMEPRTPFIDGSTLHLDFNGR